MSLSHLSFRPTVFPTEIFSLSSGLHPKLRLGLVPGCHRVHPHLLARPGPPAAAPRPARPSAPCLSADRTSTLVSHCLLDLHLSSQNPLNLTENTEQMLSKNCLYPAVNMSPLYIFTHIHRRRRHFSPSCLAGVCTPEGATQPGFTSAGPRTGAAFPGASAAARAPLPGPTMEGLPGPARRPASGVHVCLEQMRPAQPQPCAGKASCAPRQLGGW